MRKMLVLIFVLLGAANVVKAQFVPLNYNDEEFQKFLKTKITYVQKTGHADFDSLLEDAMKRYWKVSPYQLATGAEIAKADKPDVSIMQPVNFDVTISNNNYSITRSNMSLSLFNGGLKGYYPVHQVAFVCIEQKYDLTDYYKDLSLDSAYLREKFRIKDMIATMSNAIEAVKEGKSGDKNVPGKTSTSGSGWVFGISTVSKTCKPCATSIKNMSAEVYNKQLPRLKNKTLYLLKDNFRDTKAIAKVYPYKFKVVDRKEFAAAISQERKDIAYLMLTHSYWGGITIIDPSAHECIGAVHIDRCTTIDAGDIGDVVKLMEKAEKETGKK
jgi:hypothetical protein